MGDRHGHGSLPRIEPSGLARAVRAASTARPVYGQRMIATCSHLDRIADVPPGAAVCESCVAIGGTWLNLRQCLTCGRTGCCDSSPERHASAHFDGTGHPLMRSLEVGHDWTWCYLCKETLRRDPGGAWSAIDSFFDAGLWYARDLLEKGIAELPFPPTATADGFPLGVWETTYRGRHAAGALDPDQAAGLEALPGWSW